MVGLLWLPETAPISAGQPSKLDCISLTAPSHTSQDACITQLGVVLTTEC